MNERVLVTGVGAVTALGPTAGDTWHALRAGASGVGAPTRTSLAHVRFGAVAEIADFDATRHFDERELLQYDRFTQLALVAAREAAREAGYGDTPTPLARERAAVVTGCAGGGRETEDEGYRRYYRDGSVRVAPLSVPRAMTSAAASAVARELGARRACVNFATACAASDRVHLVGGFP